MNSINSIANSALQAFSKSQQVTANNIANVNTDGFTASQTTFQEQASGGAAASVTQTQDSVDISREATDLITNSHGFKSSIKALQTADDMTKELLSIKA
jgi:flagellar basal-body rod protein FlgC